MHQPAASQRPPLPAEVLALVRKDDVKTGSASWAGVILIAFNVIVFRAVAAPARDVM